MPTNSHAYDATSTSIGSDGHNVCIQVKMAGPLFPKPVKVDNWFVGTFFMDLDENQNTGIPGFADDLCGAPSGLGVDAFTSFFLDGGLLIPIADLSLLPFLAPQAKYAIFLAEGDTFKIVVPSSASGDDLFNFGLVIGNFMEPTDCLPNSGYLASSSFLCSRSGTSTAYDSASALSIHSKMLRFTAGLQRGTARRLPARSTACCLGPDERVRRSSTAMGPITSVDALALAPHDRWIAGE